MLHLRQTSLLSREDRWALVQNMAGEEGDSRPVSEYVDFQQLFQRYTAPPVEHALLDLAHATSNGLVGRTGIMAHAFESSVSSSRSLWPQFRLAQYLNAAFFFNPFRHSEDQPAVRATTELSRDGANLAQVLHTLLSRDRQKYGEIETFVQAALPDIGALQTPLTSDGSSVRTGVVFDRKEEGYEIPLHRMGGGIEQLLMVAVALLTTGDTSTLFVEEPESHLHAGAQRFLIERLFEGNRQAFVTTHSPVFVNTSRPKSLYQVVRRNNVAQVKPIHGTDLLGDVLDDIGARNSDVLLSDSVLFVEGPSDRDVLVAWADILGKGLSEHNVTVLQMGGGRHAARQAPLRSEVLEGISQKAPVPHLFVVDRDERGGDEVARLERRLGGNVHVLERRELENYLLVPRAILEALRGRYSDQPHILGRAVATGEDEVWRIICATADELYGKVLLKRIRASVRGLGDNLMPDEMVTKLEPRARDQNLAALLLTDLEERLHEHIAELDLAELVRVEVERLDAEWSDSAQHLALAPGEELLQSVYRHCGGAYDKVKDAARIAAQMVSDEIDEEIRLLIQRVVAPSAVEG